MNAFIRIFMGFLVIALVVDGFALFFVLSKVVNFSILLNVALGALVASPIAYFIGRKVLPD